MKKFSSRSKVVVVGWLLVVFLICSLLVVFFLIARTKTHGTKEK